MNITGNTIFIPGATSGIGLALAVALEEQGNTVIVGGRRAELLDAIAADHPAIDTVVIDTTSPESISDASAQVIRHHPDLNVLVAMAGIMKAEDWHNPAGFLEAAEAVITTNVLGPVRLVAAFVEHLQSCPDSTIMTVSSGLAHTPLKWTTSYNASKAAIHQLSEGLRLQLADTSVKVVELVPPAVQTELLPGGSTNPDAMPLDEFIAEVVAILKAEPDVREVLVEKVKFLRYSEVRGDYDQVVALLNGLAPPAN
ncbi:SDR family NAD(P)-dependent oxidoreductase [Streptomyces sp. GMY02]|uniref:SDR family oxidoreductase n=1 Tax=Streptomyces sp. GMY02 TaxID=1333528 RepID=UPI001C2C3569|nr:SDR family NAD(P)-dependent oxidoreductase [Streptomyces sp. GMY02]QXE33854.1 SDR family NAD(P)-dependent oxidoreductase [Streptomyces sp. GMY02]